MHLPEPENPGSMRRDDVTLTVFAVLPVVAQGVFFIISSSVKRGFARQVQLFPSSDQ
jgi:hypothetical protein